ncbi:uncharacterized protein LOC143349593 isoform X2 [Colletes latitarsis]|uniref:uncharacterized protein LOC143349593 isoform X2 n=1 Tax=Colletes latitarsis TaxID=2605962 RepID=UPI004035B1CB
MNGLILNEVEMFKKLLEHNITSCNGQFFCHLCMSMQSSLAHVSQHIKEKRHKTLKNDRIITMLEKCTEQEYQELANNQVTIVARNIFKCLPCQRFYKTVHDVSSHIQSECHVNKLRNDYINLDNEKKDALHITSIKSKMMLKRINISQVEHAMLKDTYIIKGHDKCVPLMVVKIFDNYLSEDCETLVNNGIVIIECHELMCLVCWHCYLVPSAIIAHIKAKKHHIATLSKTENIYDMHNNTKENTKIDSLSLFKIKYKKENKTVQVSQDTNVIIYKEQDTKCNKNRQDVSLLSVNNLDKQNECQIFRDNKIVILDTGFLICKICNCPLSSRDNVLSHVEGKQHVRELKQQSRKQDSKENIIQQIYHDSEIDIEKEELESVQTLCMQPITNMALPKKTKAVKCQSNLNVNNICQTNLKKIDQKLISNGIISFDCDTYSCKFCIRKFPSLHDTLLHIKGRSHVNMLKCQHVNSTTYESKDTVHENIQINITDQKSITNSLNLGININTSQYQNLNNNIHNITHYTKLLTDSTHEEEHLTNNNIDSKCNKLQVKNENDINFQNCFYCCELCNVQIDASNLFGHINTDTHKCNIFSMNMGDDIILYKCLCCKSIMQGNSILINHLRLKTHLNNLVNTLKDIKMIKKEIFVYAFHNNQNVLENNNFMLCNILLPNVESMSPNFTEKCLISCDALDIKFDNDIKNNILYNCSFCRAKLNTDHNLIEHCQGRMHMWKVKQFCNKTYSNINDNTMSLTDQFSKISITDKKSQSTKEIDKLILSTDIYTEVTRCLRESPFCLNVYKIRQNKHVQGKEKSLAERLNKVYDTRCLEIEEEMYTLNEKKMNTIKSSFKLLMPCKKKYFYCLACDISISKEIYLLYEHVCLQSHVVNVNKIKENELNTEKLSEQYIKKISKHSIKCYPCGNTFENQSIMIDIHINSKIHQQNYKKFCTIIDKTFESILQNLSNLYYSIERFSCILCGTNFKYKMEFIQHVIKHIKSSKKYMFDFCIPCATLWLCQEDSYTEHCRDIMHKYLSKSKDFMIEDLPQCIRKLLTQVDETVNILFQQTQVLLNDNIQEEVKQSLENSLKVHFPSIKVFLFGSRVNGLGFANSDIDVYVDCENTYYTNNSESLRIQYLERIVQILREQKEEWEVKNILEETRTPIIKLIYKRAGVDCDISVANGLSVENSKLIRLGNWGCTT